MQTKKQYNYITNIWNIFIDPHNFQRSWFYLIILQITKCKIQNQKKKKKQPIYPNIILWLTNLFYTTRQLWARNLQMLFLPCFFLFRLKYLETSITSHFYYIAHSMYLQIWLLVISNTIRKPLFFSFSFSFLAIPLMLQGKRPPSSF